MRLINLQETLSKQNEAIKSCIDFLRKQEGSDIAIGRHDIGDGDIYVNVSIYDTCMIEDSMWEAHKEYADFHVMLKGEENIFVADIATMELGQYFDDSDYLECNGDSEQTFKMEKGYGLLLLPKDAHMPGVCCHNQPAEVKKCVFKIPVTYFE